MWDRGQIDFDLLVASRSTLVAGSYSWFVDAAIRCSDRPSESAHLCLWHCHWQAAQHASMQLRSQRHIKTPTKNSLDVPTPWACAACDPPQAGRQRSTL
jgi:hypothetical protein